MKICEDHFDAVEQALIARGLGDLIPSPGDNHRLLRAWSKGILTLETFDPVSLALGCIRRVMTETAAAHPESAEGISMSECPLCWVDETNPPLDAPDFDSASPEGHNWLLQFGVDCACDLARKLSNDNQKKKETT